jgi:hypothetical protein
MEACPPSLKPLAKASGTTQHQPSTKQSQQSPSTFESSSTTQHQPSTKQSQQSQVLPLFGRTDCRLMAPQTRSKTNQTPARNTKIAKKAIGKVRQLIPDSNTLKALEDALNDKATSSDALHHRSMAVINELSDLAKDQDDKLRLMAGLTAIGDPVASKLGWYTGAIRRVHDMDVTQFAKLWRKAGGYKKINTKPSQTIYTELAKRMPHLSESTITVTPISTRHSGNDRRIGKRAPDRYPWAEDTRKSDKQTPLLTTATIYFKLGIDLPRP